MIGGNGAILVGYYCLYQQMLNSGAAVASVANVRVFQAPASHKHCNAVALRKDDCCEV